MISFIKQCSALLAFLCAASLALPVARADAILDWNKKANDMVAVAKLPPPPAYRAMAMVQAAVYEAVNAITGRYSTTRVKLDTAPGASVDAAVAAANRAMFLKLLPAQQSEIERAYQAAIAGIEDNSTKAAGIKVGELAAAAILAQRGDDGAAAPESYRPHTTAGKYVPTALPATPNAPQRKPWVLASADQFRPGPPPALKSDRWTRDYNEIKSLGAKNSTSRNAEQTSVARFWEATGPAIYFPIVNSVAGKPGRDITQNARLLANAGIAMDDALIAVMDAKYHHQFWRPITAIRNGDIDGNKRTDRDASWTPLVSTPMHPEYPCAHCILAGSIGAVLKTEVGNDPVPTLTTTSLTANGAARSWDRIDDFVREVANARIYDGVHYRNSTEVGTDMGRKIGELVAGNHSKSSVARK